MPTFDLEFTIQGDDTGGYVADLRADLTNHRADLARRVPLALNQEALLALISVPDAYGAALSAMVFPAPLREAWRQALGFQQASSGEPFRVRLVLDDDDALHVIRWELLHDPIRHRPLACDELTLFSRYLGTADLRDVQAPERPELRIIIAAASPEGAAMPPIDTAQEAARIRSALGDLTVITLDGQAGRPAATLAAITNELRHGGTVLTVICHGAMVRGEPFLWLEQPGARYTPVSGAAFVQMIAQLARPPLLIVIVACQSAGTDAAVWQAIGPQLARGGVAAVLAMQGNVPIATVQLLLPSFFRELRRDGVIDRAIAVARSALGPSHPWWMPILWTRVRDGRLWRDERAQRQLSQQFTRDAIEAFRDRVALAVQAHELALQDALRSGDHEPRQPYKFLYSFTLEDSARFFGRERAIQGLMQQLRTGRLTVLQAPSGTGKSSLLQAGLVPQLVASHVLPVFARANDNPITAIKQVLLPPSGGPAPGMLDVVDLAELLGLVWAATRRTYQRLVLIIDQFEEFFVATPEVAGRRALADALAACIEDPNLPLHVLLSIRSDYFADLTYFQTRLPGIYHNVYRLDPLTRSEAVAAITRPLDQLDPPRRYAPALLDQLLVDLDHAGVEPPQLQIVCTRLFERIAPQEVEIGLAHYHTLGGAVGVLRDYLHAAIDRLGTRRPLARTLLTALVSPEGTRQTCAIHELEEILGEQAPPPEIAAVLETLVAARLLRRDEQNGIGHYELAHDYMLGEIRSWMAQEDAAIRLARDTLRQGVSRWQAHGWLLESRDSALIYQARHLLTDIRPIEAELLLRSSLASGGTVMFWARLAQRRGVDFWPIMRPLVDGADVAPRARALGVLAVLGDEALPNLQAALTDPLPMIRTSAIRALEQIATPAALATLRDGLRDEVQLPDTDGMPRLYIDRYPVTYADYTRFLVACPEQTPPDDWGGPIAPRGYARHPVVGVSWEDAQAYARWAGRHLPSWAEWARAGGSDRRYPWGDDFDATRCTTRESGTPGTTPVDAHTPEGDSPSGVADLAGNVWEWLADAAPGDTSLRRLAGGAWCYSALFASLDFSGIWRPVNERQTSIGFRLCFTISPEEERV
ncbi:SUMF1/EgtB/PvdO family nonheme iron enzyme [Oscillochloris sp. ZM17-4]|uniref:nSTAND1 domain-containing NTPase n=1 Tax=Oscillochloris sp. ZM17-4 TaxID=2866714 RepID=UPI001C737CE2|nr:SUMF1/EgtB/PvdO family nonheme iron enzyme [Oscillochloris sp. ZM17-4]MBX0330026.1 SUMF1/EgtB/PvdO family nonheme iron enzyme [Oscillochloris sp. ZM17-4]